MCIIRTALTLHVFLSTANAFNASTGCGKALGYGIKKGGTGSSNTITLTSGGITRSFLLHIPTNYNINSARGLIFGFHGRGATASKQEVLSSFSDPYFNRDNLAVYPQGIDNQWQGDPEARTNDVQFTLDIIDYLAPRYCINQDAIFSTGKSNGGGFSLNIIACDPVASTRIAAFASNSGAYYATTPSTGCAPLTVALPCNPGRSTVPILEIHGSADDVIPYYGGDRRGKCLPTVPHFVTEWAKRNGLGSTNITTNTYDRQVHKHEFGQAQGKVGLVTSYWVNALTHSWASTIANTDTATPTFVNATSIMMDWFNKWNLP
ncbi:putative alpha/Beta hydrolase, feruloyl esterase B/C/D [Septoria linicola]|nr:putative alpha/Beta hydrolase, feruloyl esterase B/C/D [Septoria linicola]